MYTFVGFIDITDSKCKTMSVKTNLLLHFSVFNKLQRKVLPKGRVAILNLAYNNAYWGKKGNLFRIT